MNSKLMVAICLMIIVYGVLFAIYRLIFVKSYTYRVIGQPTPVAPVKYLSIDESSQIGEFGYYAFSPLLKIEMQIRGREYIKQGVIDAKKIPGTPQYGYYPD